MKAIVDRNLQRLIAAGVNNWPSPVHPLMADNKPALYEDYENWLPIPSTVTDDQLVLLETTIGHKLPTDYKDFLQYKHFYDLVVGQAEFFAHPVESWLDELLAELIDLFPVDCLVKGIIPFANWGGAGDLLCFDASRNQATVDYPVVLWNHESGEYYEDFSSNFAHLLAQLEAE